MTVEIKHNDTVVFVHKLTCECGHTFRIQAERESGLSFSQFGVGCPRCGAEVNTAAAGRVDARTVRQVYRLRLTWSGDSMDKRKRMDVQSDLDDEAEAQGYFGTATVQNINGDLVVGSAEVYLEDGDAVNRERWLPESDARRFVADTLAASMRRAR